MTSHSEGWQFQYPDLEAVRRASYETLVVWEQNLPPAQNVDEYAIRREIFERIIDLARQALIEALDRLDDDLFKTETHHNKNL